MDEGNDDESNANFHISETTAVDNDITSNNKGDDKTNNDTWSKDSPAIKTFYLG